MARIKICKHETCKDAATTSGYCRLHYFQKWKEIKQEEKIRSAKKLNSYIEHICKKHPDKYIEVIKEDIRSKKFLEDNDSCIAYDEQEAEQIFNDPTYDEEVKELLYKLKIDKNY